MTICVKCGASFSATRTQLAKRGAVCLACNRLYQAAWRERQRVAGLPTSGRWADRDPAQRRAYVKRYQSKPEVKQRRAAQQKRYREDPDLRPRHVARWAAKNAIASGRLSRSACSKCGSSTAEAHHEDYAQPLKVVWLCRDCHRAHHALAEGK